MPKRNKRESPDLRQRAEKVASQRTIKSTRNLDAMTPKEMLKTLHELEVHQIELEMQNEELRIAQLELEYTRERYFDLYDLAPIGYCTISAKGLILETNLSAAALLGIPRFSLNNQPISKYILKDDQDIFYLHRKHLLETGKPQSCELRMKKKNGTSFWARLEASVVPDWTPSTEKDVENQTVFRVTLSDITIPKKAEEILKRDKTSLEKLVKKSSIELIETQKELEKSKRLHDIGILAATVAHELRNPLFAISLATSLIRTQTQDDTVKTQLQIIDKMIAESGQIIDNLLFYSHMKKPQCQNLNLHSLLEACTDSIKPEHYEKNVMISKHIDSLKDVLISTDGVQIKEVFNNILNNALDAVPDSEGKIDVKARVLPKLVKIQITNNGPGIPKGDLIKIFDPFFSTKVKGTGLGLTVCGQIVKMHGGFINIKCGKEKGTSFIITLPRANPEGI